MRIDYTIRNQKLWPVSHRQAVEGSFQFVEIGLDFDEEWDSCGIVVVLSHDEIAGDPYRILYTGEPVRVPNELLVEGVLHISCVGVKDDGNTVLRTMELGSSVEISRAGESIGIAPEDVTPPLLEQIVAAIGRAEALDGIKRIETTQTETGCIVTIKTEKGKETVFEILNGENGKDGNGISKLETEKTEGGNKLTFKMDDGSEKEILVMDGKNGSDGKKGERGEKGEKGNGIQRIDFVKTAKGVMMNMITDDEAYSIELLNGEKGEKGEIGIPGQRGEKGETGNCYFPLFDVDPETGMLQIITDDGYNGPEFKVNGDTGILEVTYQ